MRRAPLPFAVVAAILFAASTVGLRADALFDNWNPEACDATDVAVLRLPRPTHVDRVDLWFAWRRGETRLRYSVTLKDEAVAEGELVRADCDPTQPSWCVARVEPDADLDPGDYVFKTERPGICRNDLSRGEGFIRAFGSTR